MFDYIDFGVRAGIPMRAMLRHYRDTGHAIRTADFLEQWNKHKIMVEKRQVAK